MEKDDPDERPVYLACRHIFRGTRAEVRRRKTVINLIQQNKRALRDILREYSIDRTCNVVKKFLDDQVFGSTNKSQASIPGIVDVSPTQSAEQEASEAEAARDETNAVREISERDGSREVAIISQAQPDNKARVYSTMVCTVRTETGFDPTTV